MVGATEKMKQDRGTEKHHGLGAPHFRWGGHGGLPKKTVPQLRLEPCEVPEL